MREASGSVRRAPIGDAAGGGGPGGSGAPIQPSPGGLGGGGTPAPLQPKPPNAFTPPPAAGPAAGAQAPAPGAAGESKPKIHAFSQALGGRKHSENWKRKTNVTGSGATHVRSFHCKLNSESLEYMDQQINEWLDNHPDYEVKMVSSSVGEWTGKIKEPALIVTVWV